MARTSAETDGWLATGSSLLLAACFVFVDTTPPTVAGADWGARAIMLMLAMLVGFAVWAILAWLAWRKLGSRAWPVLLGIPLMASGLLSVFG